MLIGRRARNIAADSPFGCALCVRRRGSALNS
jgi:hypothetical protein